MDEGICIVDMEAGLELFGRGTPSASDLLVVVVEPSRWSIETAARISALARELGIAKLGIIANKVHDELDTEWIRQALTRYDLDLLAVVPYDKAVITADRHMRALVDEAPESPAARAITAVADSIETALGVPVATPHHNGTPRAATSMPARG